MILVPFEEVQVGDTRRSRGRTITETDVVSFCYLTGNWLELHSNTEFARQTQFGQRVVQGSLAFSILAGLADWNPEYIRAFYGVDNLRFRAPVFIGDTLTLEWTVRAKVPKEYGGVVDIDVVLHNQDSLLVQSCIFKLAINGQSASRPKEQSA